ncbi:rod shape-determining protein MreC [Paenibacillus radicis (ex Gao et al. 2016)]|uniref:Cell shape-determining protein MreC n=1 Tax=Paenibacillus radicis (ex Gao et al. 2016) TaxID=1737354 RepID=A0A917HCN9_9BACL|nr:rod shape-determining protein MreC [Paenibacillus radicis (ex Gao et al. 2016)]GGG74292.1 cell shape-determining protein MreC [Paenibacillus radicis (ex Gao et al. 2016)]
MFGFILFIAVIGFSLSDRKELTMPEKFLGDSVGFAQSLFYKPAGIIAGFFEDIRNLRTIHEENEQLKLMAAAYARDKINYNFIEQENKRFKEELDFTERQEQLYNYKYRIAQVVAVNNDTSNRTMVINLGSKNGIKKNMAVTTVDGLIGLVSEVRPFTSTVMPITELDEKSPNSNLIAATILGKIDSFGIISSYNQETDRLMMTKIDEKDKMIVDDVVITSGLGNVYPRGLVIGTVENKQVGDFGLTYTASVKLAAKFDHLTEVFVVEVQDIEDAAE